MLTYFAAEGTGVPLAAEPVVNLFGLTVTNSMLFGLVMAIVVLSLFASAAKRSRLNPTSKFAFLVESLVDFVLDLGEQNFGSREKAIRHMPLLLTLFTFILFSNLSGLIPGVGSITVTHSGSDEATPLLRAFTADLNSTLAMALLTIGSVQFYALKELGLLGHLKHYFTNEPWKPMNLLIGLNEVMGEFIRIMTLSMRLFGVIYAGEVLLHVIAELSGSFGWATTIPIYFMEIFFSGIQAYLFMMLSMVYLAIATRNEHAHDEYAESVPPARLAAAGNSKS